MTSIESVLVVGVVMTAVSAVVTWLLLRSKRDNPLRMVSWLVKSKTEEFSRVQRRPSANLSLADSAGAINLPMSIPLWGSTLRIGRDPNLVNVVLDDRRISRLHCRISEEDGRYKVLDEGSTSGTYVNEIEVGIDGFILQNGDVLGIGPVNYRFEAETDLSKSTDDLAASSTHFGQSDSQGTHPGS